LQNFFEKKRSMSDWFSKHDECFEASKLLCDRQESVHFDNKATIENHSDGNAYELGRVLI
jgi:hypothetical protein